MKIVFMGTPEFAAGILNQITAIKEHEVKAVVTVADKPAGRGRKLRESAVKIVAQEKNIPVLQPLNLKDPDFLRNLESYDADVFVVVAFRMLPKEVWQMPKKGTFNLHASLLPKYRGAAPINWAIINGEKTTGVTTFFIDEKIDTGEIILQKEIQIEDKDNLESLHDNMMQIGGDLVIQTLNTIALNQTKTTIQPEYDPSPAPKLNAENCKINWEKSKKDIFNHIRGLDPYPGAWTLLNTDKDNSIKVKIHGAALTNTSEIQSLHPGQVLISNKKLYVGCEDGALEITRLKLQGKKLMDTKSLLNGYTFCENARFH